MRRITFARLAVLLLAAGALALSGCGGDDNGVDQSLQNTLTAERDAALQDKMDAEERAAVAEQAKMDAEERAAVRRARPRRTPRRRTQPPCRLK